MQLPRIQGLVTHACSKFCTVTVRLTILLHSDTKVVYRRYASLFFIAGCDSTDNELITLEIVHRYVEQMDKYYGNVCELDIIFNFQKAYFILDELLLAGELQETSKKNVLRCISQQDSLEDMEVRLILLDFHIAQLIVVIDRGGQCHTGNVNAFIDPSLQACRCVDIFCRRDTLMPRHPPLNHLTTNLPPHPQVTVS